MATTNPNDRGSDDAGDGDSVEEPEDTAEESNAASSRKSKRERKAAERDHVRQAKAAERDRRRLAKAAEKREKAASKARAKKEREAKAGKPKSEEVAKPEAGGAETEDGDAKPEKAEKPKRSRRPRAERKPKPPAERKRGAAPKAETDADEKRRPRRERRKRSERGDEGRRSRRKRSGAGAKATLAKALPSRKKDDSSADSAKPKRAKGERKPPNTVEKAFTQVLAILGAVIAGVVGVVAVVVKALAGPTAKVRSKITAWIAAVSRFMTPIRGLLLAAIGCAVLLGLSQFVDYRGISIGADAYAPGIQSVAPAPEVEREELGSAHSYLMIPVALIAILALVIAVRTRRWQLCRLVVLLGIVAIAVAIFVDRPAGLDEGDLNRDFTGVEAKLLGGYWMQIFAGAGLALTSLLLAGEIKREAPARARRKAPSDPSGSEESEGSGKGKRRRFRGRRGATGAEGAGA